MSSAVAVREPQAMGLLARCTEDQIKVLKTQVTYPGISDTELDYFLTVSERVGLDPYAYPREIYAIERKGKMTIQPGVDGLVKLATKRGDLEWIGDAEFHVQVKGNWEWSPMWMPTMPVSHIRVSIKRKSSPMVSTWTIRKGAYEVDSNPLWKTKPDVMMAAAAIRNALRKSGVLYSVEIPDDLRSIVKAEEPRWDEETGELLCSNGTRQALHSGHNHAEVHAVAVEVAGVDSVAELTEEQAQEVLEVLNTPDETGQTTIVEMGKPTSRDRQEEV